MEVQQALGADVAVAFDQPVFPGSTAARDARIAMDRTHRWAERSLRAHERPDQALFGVIQGGLDAGMREESTRFIAGLPFDGINIGGLAGDETPEQRRVVVRQVADLLDEVDGQQRVRYLMGLGSPADLLDAVHLGVDIFDSVLPSRVARNGQCWVPGGRLNLRNERFRDDPAPIQDGCPCIACRTFSRAYVAHLFRAGELLAFRLATCHNLTFTLDFMAGIRAALRARNLPQRLPELRAHASQKSGSEVAVQSA